MNLKNKIFIGAMVIVATGFFTTGYMVTSNVVSKKMDSEINIEIEKKLEKYDLKNPKGKVITYENFDYEPEDIYDVCNTYEELLNRVVFYINCDTFEAMKVVTHTVRNVGDQDSFKKIRVSVVSSQVIEEEENCKLVKFVLEVEDPGESKMKKGKNIKYAYLAKAYDKYDEKRYDYLNVWLASPLFDEDELSKVKGIRYYKKNGIYSLECWGENINAGFGFKDKKNYEKMLEEMDSFEADDDWEEYEDEYDWEELEDWEDDEDYEIEMDW